jgi:hypothetical protein
MPRQFEVGPFILPHTSVQREMDFGDILDPARMSRANAPLDPIRSAAVEKSSGISMLPRPNAEDRGDDLPGGSPTTTSPIRTCSAVTEVRTLSTLCVELDSDNGGVSTLTCMINVWWSRVWWCGADIRQG